MVEIKFVPAGSTEARVYMGWDGITLGEFADEYFPGVLSNSTVTVNNAPVDDRDVVLSSGDKVQLIPKSHKSGN
jgi:molybdopterin converting factor small subunit